ncbi:MAG TPA: DnaA/Hda family protein [Ideonella sp.]|nr:DnaA/Hda family protein [Ideonella sp.]
MKQLPLAMAPEAVQDFDAFEPGDNALVLAHLRGLVQPGTPAQPPVYLHGPGGTGKSHLLHALQRQVAQQGRQAAWFDAERPLPWEFDDAWSLVLIDGADRLSPEQQHAAFTLFVEAATHAVQMVSAGRLPPVDLAVREDLRTRFGWGPVFALQALDEAGTRSVLLREAGRMGLKLTPDVMDYLLTRFARDLSSLMSLLQQLNSFSIAELRPVTVPLLKKMIAEEGLAA